MSDGPRPRRPIKVVIMVVVYWVVGNVLQSTIGGLLERGGVVSADTAFFIGLILGWGLLFLVSLYYREQLDAWLRS